MNKRFLSLILAIFVSSTLIAALPVSVSAEQHGDLYYQVDNNTVTITLCNRNATAIDIPSQINGLPVTSIGNSTFWGCRSLTSITIPNSVTDIGKGAFCFCGSLNISVDNNNENFCDIDGVLFSKDKKAILSYAKDRIQHEYEIPYSVTSIDDCAFSHCSSLTDIAIPSGVTSIGDRAFNDCGSLNISVDNNNKNFCDIDGVLFSKDKKAILSYAKDKIQNEYEIPNGVTSIGNNAFSSCDSLTSITIPSGVTSIGESAFSYCDSLTNITIPSGVTSIDDYAFSHCSVLTGITIPGSVTSIGDWAFSRCSSLTGITIPSSVTNISNNMFSQCGSLTSIAIPSSVTSIGDWAFSQCWSLTSIAIPSSVTSIGDWAFEKCSSLTDVYYGGSAEQWSNVSIVSSVKYLTQTNIHYNKYYPVSGVADSYLYESNKVTANICFNHIREANAMVVAVYDKNDTLTAISRTNAETTDDQISVSCEADENCLNYKAKILFRSSLNNLKPFGRLASNGIGLHIFESSHPYSNSCDEIKTYVYNGGCESLSVTFSDETETGNNHNYIYIYDMNNNEIGRYSGTELSGAIVTIPGNMFKIRLTSDSSGAKYGYKMKNIVVNL